MSNEITPRELLGQLRECVVILAAEPRDQLAWLDAHGFPVVEMWAQLEDAVPGWFPRLEENGQITEAGKAAVIALLDVLRSHDNPALWEDEVLSLQEPEWQQIRAQARSALSALGEETADEESG